MQATALTHAPVARLKHLTAAVALCAGLGAASLDAHGGAVIFNSLNPSSQTAALGVNNEGHLNFFPGVSPNGGFGNATGISLLFPDGYTGTGRDGTFQDATSPGCLCEGWGLAATIEGGTAGGRYSGYANVASDGGAVNLINGVFGATTVSATSTVTIGGTQVDPLLASSGVIVTHRYGVSLAQNTFQGNVTIQNNTDGVLTDIVYRRVMDWDIPPTEFNEFVTHRGVAANLTTATTPGNVLYASNNGFASANPDSGPSTRSDLAVNTDFEDLGPDDHGSLFDFSFDPLLPGESRSFNIFYGAFLNEADALAAVSVLNPTLYSLGQPNLTGVGGGGEGGGEEPPPCDVDCPEGPIETLAAAAAFPPGVNETPTFLFAFGGVGGVEPGSDPDHPILPFAAAPGQFTFVSPEPRRWYDPPFTSGFEYEITGGVGSFASVMTPEGFGDLTLMIGDTSMTLEDGFEFIFGPGVTKFKLFDSSDRFDIEDPTVLPTFLDFVGRPTGFTMTAIALPPTDVPAPAALVLLLAGLAGLRLRRTVH